MQVNCYKLQMWGLEIVWIVIGAKQKLMSLRYCSLPEGNSYSENIEGIWFVLPER